ncbi:DUF1642 domain-containing protein [Lactiplantibacillus argentoratensis]|uniref:DUF1642 domain-containing protein n=1 Tax=Lactiplantibacillus argentoratensis TaxID=271881 RepID=UPI003EBB0830
MIKIYRKMATIKAEQFDPENGVIPDGVFDKEFEHTTSGMISAMVNELQTGKQAHNWHIKTLEGDLKVNPGDWIATGVNGEHWPIADGVFKQTYAELPVIPKNVANYLTDCKRANTTIGTSLSGNIVLFGHARSHDMIHDILSWLCPSDNQDLFARAWLDGYTVEEDK